MQVEVSATPLLTIGGVDNVEYYLDSAKHQLHNLYLVKPVHIMTCYCHCPLIMALSQSEKNPGRLYLKCSICRCNRRIMNAETKPKLGWKGVESRRGAQDSTSSSYPSKETSRWKRPKFENVKKKERRRMLNDKRGNVSIQRKWEMKTLMNGNENMCRREKKNGGMVNDVMERRRWGFVQAPLKGIGSGTSKVTWQALIGQPIS